MLHTFCVAALIYCICEVLLLCMVQGGWHVICAVQHCDLYVQQVKGPLHPCGPVHNHRLT